MFVYINLRFKGIIYENIIRILQFVRNSQEWVIDCLDNALWCVVIYHMHLYMHCYCCFCFHYYRYYIIDDSIYYVTAKPTDGASENWSNGILLSSIFWQRKRNYIEWQSHVWVELINTTLICSIIFRFSIVASCIPVDCFE